MQIKADGHCWCGCGKPTSRRAFFVPSHDRKAEAAVLAIHYGGSIAQVLAAHGYGPGRKNLCTAVTELKKTSSRG